MNNLKVYLAGPISSCSYEGAIDWREHARKELLNFNIDGFSPMRSKEYLLGKTSIVSAQGGSVLSTQKGIVTRDRNDVMTCDALIVNLLGAQKPTLGTMIELGWADAWRKPIILVMENENLHDHAMVRELAGFILPTLDEAIDIAIKLLKPNASLAEAKRKMEPKTGYTQPAPSFYDPMSTVFKLPDGIIERIKYVKKLEKDLDTLTRLQEIYLESFPTEKGAEEYQQKIKTIENKLAIAQSEEPAKFEDTKLIDVAVGEEL